MSAADPPQPRSSAPPPPGFPLPPIDAGHPLAAGVLVRIPPIPAWLSRDLPEPDVVALRSLEGSIRRILRFDDHGYAWFGHDDTSGWFSLRPDELRLEHGKCRA